jgi:tetratricopeptide (TPR) repeat protein
MEVSILCSAEVFITKSNEIIIPPFEHGYHHICTLYKEHSQAEREAQNEALANALDLASAICSMMLRPNSTNDPFQPFIQLEGKRSAIADDFTSEQLGFIADVYSGLEEPMVKARFADLLWLCVNPKRVDFVRVAIRNYLMLPIDPETWHSDVGDCWKRCIRLARQVKDSESIGAIEAAFQSAFEKVYPDSPFMHLWIAELIENNRLCTDQYELIAESLFEYATGYHTSGSYREAREYLSLTERMFKAQGKEENWLNCLVLLADGFELEGDSRCGGDTPSQMVANSFYENALQAYRKIPLVKRDALGVTIKLASIREKITEAGSGSLSEMGLIQTPGIDISEMIDCARKHVEDKDSLDLALLCFTGFTTPKYQELRTRTIEEIQEFPLSNLFGGTHMASDGRVIAKTPALHIDAEGDENEQVIINKTIQSFQFDTQIAVKGQIAPALHQILSEFRVTKQYLQKICYHSPIVPEGREYLMASALWGGFEHDFGNSIHLLAPQIEHLVRTTLKSRGLNTSNIDVGGVENENSLATLLNHERAEEVLGEDLLFEFKAVFTESVGPNLRNEVAHGLLDDQSSAGVASVYAWWMVLRLVIRSLYKLQITDMNE